jgi:hypothetical protein
MLVYNLLIESHISRMQCRSAGPEEQHKHKSKCADQPGVTLAQPLSTTLVVICLVEASFAILRYM